VEKSQVPEPGGGLGNFLKSKGWRDCSILYLDSLSQAVPLSPLGSFRQMLARQGR
jgi:hypothetical protein